MSFSSRTRSFRSYGGGVPFSRSGGSRKTGAPCMRLLSFASGESRPFRNAAGCAAFRTDRRRGGFAAGREPGDAARSDHLPHLTAPDDHHLPPQISQAGIAALVSRRVLQELRPPERFPSGGHARVSASLVPMPEASVHEDGQFVAGQDNIRASRQIPPLQPKPIPQRKEEPAHGHLGLGVPASYGGHIPMSLFRRECIHEKMRVFKGT